MEYIDLLGCKAQFDPFEDMDGYGMKTVRQTATGTVVYVNQKHKWFSVEYGDPKQRISFLFSDIGEKVQILGKKRRQNEQTQIQVVGVHQERHPGLSKAEARI